MLTGSITLSLGDQHSMVLWQDGSVWSTDLKSRGQIPSRRHFEEVISSGATSVAAGNGFSMVLKEDGSVWGVGRNSYGQLGDGTRVKRDFFSFSQTVPGAKAVSAGGSHAMVLTYTGRVRAMGRNKYGELGEGTMALSIKGSIILILA